MGEEREPEVKQTVLCIVRGLRLVNALVVLIMFIRHLIERLLVPLRGVLEELLCFREEFFVDSVVRIFSEFIKFIDTFEVLSSYLRAELDVSVEAFGYVFVCQPVVADLCFTQRSREDRRVRSSSLVNENAEGLMEFCHARVHCEGYPVDFIAWSRVHAALIEECVEFCSDLSCFLDGHVGLRWLGAWWWDGDSRHSAESNAVRDHGELLNWADSKDCVVLIGCPKF